MEVFLIKTLQLILCFSLLILLHEGGHFFFSKLFKVRVEKFCLFFDPWKTLLKFKPKKSDTEYCLGWLPLGGYVKISGMIDESMDKEQMKQPPQPWEFRSHPAWQRLLIMIGGVLVNFLLALLIYSMVMFCWGEDYIPLNQMTMGMKFNTEAKALGFADGDVLLRTDKGELKHFSGSEAISAVYRDISEAKVVTVLRKGKEVNINMPAEGLNMLDMFREIPPFVSILLPSSIDSVLADGPAAKAGIRKGDVIVGFNQDTINTWNDYILSVNNLSNSLKDAPTDDSIAARHVTVMVRRAETEVIDTLPVMLNSDLMMGVVQASAYSFYKPVHISYGFFESFPAGIKRGCAVLKGYVGDLKYLFSKEGAKSVGSFGVIGSMFPKMWDWQRFWETTAFISIILAFMNILPIPALDGGHVLFLLVEVITRRKPSEKFMENAQMIGMAILLLLMVYAVGNDIFRFLIKG